MHVGVVIATYFNVTGHGATDRRRTVIMARRESTNSQTSEARERTSKLLERVERRLRRSAKNRAKPEYRDMYLDAAARIRRVNK